MKKIVNFRNADERLSQKKLYVIYLQMYILNVNCQTYNENCVYIWMILLIN